MKAPSIFLSDKSPWRAGSAQLACSAKLSRQARQSQRVEGHGPMLIQFTFLKSLEKIVQNTYQPAQSDDIFLKVGTPSLDKN